MMSRGTLNSILLSSNYNLSTQPVNKKIAQSQKNCVSSFFQHRQTTADKTEHVDYLGGSALRTAHVSLANGHF